MKNLAASPRQVLGARSLYGLGFTHGLHSTSFLGFPYRILNINHKKELLRGPWVGFSVAQAFGLAGGRGQAFGIFGARGIFGFRVYAKCLGVCSFGVLQSEPKGLEVLGHFRVSCGGVSIGQDTNTTNRC